MFFLYDDLNMFGFCAFFECVPHRFTNHASILGLVLPIFDPVFHVFLKFQIFSRLSQFGFFLFPNHLLLSLYLLFLNSLPIPRIPCQSPLLLLHFPPLLFLPLLFNPLALLFNLLQSHSLLLLPLLFLFLLPGYSLLLSFFYFLIHFFPSLLFEGGCGFF